MRFIILSICFFVFLSCYSNHKIDAKYIGEIIKLDDQLDKIIDPRAKIEVIAEGFSWSEGPLWIESEKMLLWSDVPNNIVYSWKEGEKAKEYLNPSGYTGTGWAEGSNGLLLNSLGELLLCQHGDRIIAKMDAPLNAPQPLFVALADNFEGKKFNSPNDAVFGKDGSLYFTDPPYGLPGKDDDPAKEISFNGIYRLTPNGAVLLMDSSLRRPNGIAINPHFTKAYVGNSDPEMIIWKVYDIDNSGNFINGSVFFDANANKPGKKGLPDGLKISKNGIIFATGPGGVLIFTETGEHLGTISIDVPVANCALNSDENILFITAQQYVAKIELK